ncbi:MAG: ABC transporter substrate-binding protein [Propionibacteriaceae bacterium]|jgi:putative ABC transport system substrate-binding protein|nr:ABC transporter substrate-binding protein [Propionibacteriaceae bacterium]
MKKIASIVAAAAAAALMFSGCASEQPAEPTESPTAPETTAAEEPTAEAQTFKIAITKFLAHPSLDLIADGFKDALTDAGVTAEYVEDDAQAEVANTTTIAGKYAADPSINLILGIATPSAQALVTSIKDRPILYAGVTDPVTAGIVPSWDASGTNVSGTSDLNPEGKPLGLILEAMGAENVKKVGFPYTLAEKNSEVQLEQLQAEAEGTGVEIVPAGVSNASELTQGLESLKSKGVDAIHVGTDNTIVGAISQVVSFGQQNKIPIFSLDANSVSEGTVAARGIDYYKLGVRTGEMAVQILVQGVDVGTIPQLQVTDTQVVANPTAADSMGLTLPEAFTANAEIVGGE